MHWITWCGVLLTLGCCGAFGAALARFEGARARQAMGFVALLRHLRAQIECYAMPCEELLAALPPRLRADCAFPQNGGSLSALLAGTPLFAPREIGELMQRFAAELGKGYREEQLRCCDYYLAGLSPLCDRVTAELPKRLRMAWLLPLALGAAFLLLLI